MCKLQGFVNFDYDFSMLPDAADVHYNFQNKKEILSCQFYASFVSEAFIFLRDVCKLQNVANFNCDFSMLPDAADLHYNFQTKKEGLSCQFNVSFVGEAFIFLRDVCKLQNVLNFDCDFSLLPDVADIHYNFQTKRRF